MSVPYLGEAAAQGDRKSSLDSFCSQLGDGN